MFCSIASWLLFGFFSPNDAAVALNNMSLQWLLVCVTAVCLQSYFSGIEAVLYASCAHANFQSFTDFGQANPVK